MGELIHTKDKGRMIDDQFSKKFIKCNKCGFKVLKSAIFDRYEAGCSNYLLDKYKFYKLKT